MCCLDFEVYERFTLPAVLYDFLTLICFVLFILG